MQELIEVPGAEQPVTVNISRTVLPGRENEFESLIRAFAPQALTFPGHLGVHVMRPASTSRDYHVVLKFATRAQWRRFQESAEYGRFRDAIEPLLEREPCVQEMTGLESWFVSPHSHVLRPLPRWKMAMVTLLGVYPTSLLIGVFIRPQIADQPLWWQSLIVAVSMVGMLTWGVMPLLTRLFTPWLYPPANSAADRPVEDCT